MERIKPSAARVDAAGITGFLAAAEQRGFDLHSLMVARNGKVVAEGWTEPYSPDAPQLVYSCSKSFTATAAGFLVTDGVLDMTTKVLDHLPWDELSIRREAVTPVGRPCCSSTVYQ